MKNILLALLLVSTVSALHAQTKHTLQTSTYAPVSVPGFDRFELVELDLTDWYTQWQSTGETLTFDLATPGGELSFDLVRTDLRAPGRPLHVTGKDRAAGLVPRLPSAQFVGQANAAGAGRAVFTIDQKFVMGSWTIDGLTYNLEPLWLHDATAPRSTYLLYRNEDAATLPNACGVTDAGTTPPGAHDHDDEPAAGGKSVGLCYEVQIALAADYEMYQLFNNATSTENFILNTLANVQGNYDDEFEDALTYIVTATEIATSNASDPWTNSTDAVTLLNDFVDWGNAGNFGATYDVASLWSGRDYDGATVGVAYTPGVCSQYRYNVLQRFNTNAASLRVMWAHELGHNFGAQHDGSNGFIMSPSVNSTTTWSGTSIATITNTYQTASCFSTCAPPVPPTAVATASVNQVCAGGSVSFFDLTDSENVTRSWNFPGGSPATSSAAAPVVSFATPGTYTAVLTAGNQFGSTQETVTITVTDDNPVAPATVFFENFEGGAGQMVVSNPDGQTTWAFGEVPGTLGEVVAFVDNYNASGQQGQIDRMSTPPLDISGLADPVVRIQYAYRRYSATYNDQLKVYVNNGNGETLVFTGNENAGSFATGPDLTTAFVPSDSDDWCGDLFDGGCLEIDLSAFAGESNLTVIIENLCGYGNTMLIDNVRVSGSCAAAALPVTWLSFAAAPRGKNVSLDWSVIQENDNAGFTVERSRPGRSDWSAIGYVAATPTTGEPVDFAYADTEVTPGATYLYRLRQEDRDGTYAYSEVRTVQLDDVQRTSVFPNPADNLVRVVAAADAGTVELLDPLGRTLRRTTLSAGAANFDVSDLPAAVYTVRVRTAGADELLRLVKR